LPPRALENSPAIRSFGDAVAASLCWAARMSQPPLYRLPEVLEQMETVGDLPRLRSPFACALVIEPGAIPTNHFDRRMPFEPLGG